MSQTQRQGPRNRALPSLLAGAGLDWPAFTAPAATTAPAEWDETLRAALGAALATPDICLICGGSSAIRATLAGEIAARTPGRVLMIAPDVSALDDRCQRRCPECARPSWLGRIGAWFGRKRTAACPHARTTTAPFHQLPNGEFDSVIVLEAHELSEPLVAAAANRADRCVLLGNRSESPFHRIVQRVRFDAWVREGERLVCRLRAVPADRSLVETEAVADRPDIELRILADPAGEPELAEVAFPAHIGIVEAKNYIAQQLGDTPLCTAVDAVSWRETPETLHADFAPLEKHAVVPLANGVSESVAEIAGRWTLLGLRFDRSAGWDRTSASAWLRKATERSTAGRVIHLTSRRSAEDTLTAPALETLA